MNGSHEAALKCMDTLKCMHTINSKSKSKSYDLLRMEIYIEHKIFCQLKHDQD